jgi:PAS domain S-box-containing protein
MRGESALDESVYRGAFERIDTPSFIADTGFVIRDMNAAGLAFTGYEYDEIVGQSATTVATDEEVYADIVDTVVGGEPWSGDFELQTKDGRTVIGQGSAAPIILDGETRGFVAVFIDKTKEREYQNTAEVLGRLLRHDLRNDLNALYGFVQQAQLQLSDADADANLEKAKEKLAEIMSKSERARELRKHLEQTYEASNQPVRLDHTLHEALVENINRFEDAEFYFDDFQNVEVVADQLLPTVLESIVENAIVHNDAATPIVEIDVEERESDAIVTVSDNGPGIPEGHEDLIFGREEVSQLHHGSGVSLFFVDNVVQSYQGEVWVERDGTDGATFKLRLEKA